MSSIMARNSEFFSKGELMSAKEMGVSIHKHVLLHERDVNVPYKCVS